MKKLISIVSFILCSTMLMMGVTAAGSTADSEDALDIFKKAMDKACGLKYVDIQGVYREKTIYEGETENAVEIEAEAARFRIIALPGKKVSAEALMWDENSEIISLDYVKDGFYYDSLKRKNYGYDEDMRMEYLMYGLVGTDPYSYKSDLQNLTAQKIPDGYELRYKISSDYANSSDYIYTVVLGKDYIIKSVNVSYRDLNTYPKSNTAHKYEFVSVDEPFVIDFPRDLNTYSPYYE